MANRKLGRKSAHRNAMFRNQLASMIDHERIITTLIKAKELRPQIEKMVTLGKEDSIHGRRLAARIVPDETLRDLYAYAYGVGDNVFDVFTKSQGTALDGTSGETPAGCRRGSRRDLHQERCEFSAVAAHLHRRRRQRRTDPGR